MATETNIISNLPVPPGEYLAEVIEELGMTKSELARRMGRPLPKLSAIFSGEKAVTPDTALQLERATGVPAHVWTGLESEYRLAQARQRAEEHEAECATEAPLVARYCYRELVKLKVVPACTRAVDKVQALQAYFGVMSLNSVLEMPRYKVAFRHGATQAADRSPEAVAAWLRVGELEAHKAECAPFSREGLTESLARIRSMTTQKPRTFQSPLRTLLADAGVVLVFCPHFPKTRAHGATFFITPEKAVVMLTLRYKWADVFWFTLFHELGHLLLHGVDRVIVEDSRHTPEEREADAFARDTLIPPADWEAFAASPQWDGPSIVAFSKRQSVHPGIVVGRLQHEKRISPAAANHLRTRYTFA